jgi:hypothetical protein
MRVAGVTVAASELTPAVRIDAPSEIVLPLRNGAIDDGSRIERVKFDQMPLVYLLSTRCQTRNPGQVPLTWLEDWKELLFRFLFAHAENITPARRGRQQGSLRQSFPLSLAQDTLSESPKNRLHHVARQGREASDQ